MEEEERGFEEDSWSAIVKQNGYSRNQEYRLLKRVFRAGGRSA